jgi:hypothetical protein
VFSTCAAIGGSNWDHSALIKGLEHMANFSIRDKVTFAATCGSGLARDIASVCLRGACIAGKPAPTGPSRNTCFRPSPETTIIREPAMSVDPQQFLRELFDTAIDAAHPQQVLEAHLPADRSGRVIVIGAGKAAAAMAEVVELLAGRSLRPGRDALRPRRPCQKIEVVEAAHPVPDAAGLAVAKRVLELVSNLTEDDRVIFLLSGGARPCWPCPPKASPWPTSSRSTRPCSNPARPSAR